MFLSQSRSILVPLLHLVVETNARSTQVNQLRTLQSHKSHFCVFLKEAGLGGNPAPVGLSQATRNYVSMCYTTYLTTGATTLAIIIKVDTLNKYLFVAIKMSYDKGPVNPILIESGHKAAFVQETFNTAKCWEKVPYEYVPFAQEMMD